MATIRVYHTEIRNVAEYLSVHKSHQAVHILERCMFTELAARMRGKLAWQKETTSTNGFQNFRTFISKPSLLLSAYIQTATASISVYTEASIHGIRVRVPRTWLSCLAGNTMPPL